MVSYPITLDGVTYPHIHVVNIKRSFQVLDGQNAGRVMTGEMERDVIGTYYNYSFEIDQDEATPAEYDAFYEVITAPTDAHTIVVPYAQTTFTFRAYVTQGNDALEAMLPSQNRWGSLSFNFIAMSPARTPT